MAEPRGGDAYFSDFKKGEVNDIRAMLRDPTLAREPARKREVLKKVVAYMTMGLDMSRLFSDMVMVWRLYLS
jgi:vesicle coat complex subunit